MAVTKSYYDILGVPKTASDDEIRIAYKKQALALHPDRNPGKGEEFQALNIAYSFLSSTKDDKKGDKNERKESTGGEGAKKRKKYDDYLLKYGPELAHTAVNDPAGFARYQEDQREQEANRRANQAKPAQQTKQREQDQSSSPPRRQTNSSAEETLRQAEELYQKQEERRRQQSHQAEERYQQYEARRRQQAHQAEERYQQYEARRRQQERVQEERRVYQEAAKRQARPQEQKTRPNEQSSQSTTSFSQKSSYQSYTYRPVFSQNTNIKNGLFEHAGGRHASLQERDLAKARMIEQVIYICAISQLLQQRQQNIVFSIMVVQISFISVNANRLQKYSQEDKPAINGYAPHPRLGK